MHEELIAWRAQVEQQLVEIKNSLSSIQASKQPTAFSPPASERWEDWLENSNLYNIQGNELSPFYENIDIVNGKQPVALQNPYSVIPPQMVPGSSSSEEPDCARDLQLYKEEMANMKRYNTWYSLTSYICYGSLTCALLSFHKRRDVLEPVPKKQEEDHANVTPDSSATANSKSDLDNSLVPFQVMSSGRKLLNSLMQEFMFQLKGAYLEVHFHTGNNYGAV